jgi:hypothetical protein
MNKEEKPFHFCDGSGDCCYDPNNPEHVKRQKSFNEGFMAALKKPYVDLGIVRKRIRDE